MAAPEPDPNGSPARGHHGAPDPLTWEPVDGAGPDAPAAGLTLPAASTALTDFLDTETLQQVQDAFSSLTGLRCRIVDAAGASLTRPTDPELAGQADAVMEQLLHDEILEVTTGTFHAPIVVEQQQLGSIVVQTEPLQVPEPADTPASDDGTRAGPDPDADASQSAARGGPGHAAAIRFLFLTANSIARLCHQTHQARYHLRELRALYRVTTTLSASNDLQEILDTAARTVAEVLDVDAVVIRLLEDGPDGPALNRRANFGLSESYIHRNSLLVNRSEFYGRIIRGEAITIEDLPNDPRTYYPELAREEGLTSMLAVGMVDRGQPIGAMQAYTLARRRHSREEVKLAQAVAQLLAAAIAKARLESDRQKNAAMVRQLGLAADVQQRMLPRHSPAAQGVDIAARYLPSYRLSGDFYDFIALGDGHIGLAIGDVAGKGIAASLLMASVRASLRAYAHDLFHLDQIIRRVNVALNRDTLVNEFVTLWYGTLDPRSRRLTYCNAGHEPPLLIRGGTCIPLDIGGMIAGIDPAQQYDKGVIDLLPGDLLLLYTDGLPDAMSPDDERFGRTRTEALLRELAAESHLSAAQTLQRIVERLRQHRAGRRATDDTTLVALRVHAHA